MARGDLACMGPGRLDSLPGITTLRSISPSTYTQLIQCKLRAIWQGSKHPALLPSSPKTRLGTVAHKLLQESAEGKLNGLGTTGIESRWDELVQDAEEAMRNNWRERHLAPLQDNVSTYEVTKWRAVSKATSISDVTSGNKIQQNNKTPKKAGGVEHKIETGDGVITGSIDRVLLTETGAVIQDYKTGEILDDTDQIKSEYRTQLMLYAAVWALNTGEWPVRLELIPMVGEPLTIQFAPSECLAIVEQAKLILHELNTCINSDSSTTDIERALQLASPRPETCGWCQYRPVCPAYLRADKSKENVRTWPKDIIGILHRIDVLQNSKLRLTVRVIGNEGPFDVVRDLSSSERRHPAISLINVGDTIGLFTLSRPERVQTYSESLLTTTYCYSDDLRYQLL